jgi:hypothetical protein
LALVQEPKWLGPEDIIQVAIVDSIYALNMIKYLSILRLYSFFTKVVPINSPYHLQYCCFGCLPRFNLMSPSTDFLVAKVLLSSEYLREKHRRNEKLEKGKKSWNPHVCV